MVAFYNSASIASRIAQLPWSMIEAQVNAEGYATTGTLLTADECAALITSYADGAAFRSRVVMARHGYGRGEYQYFSYPLPSLIATGRAALYPRLSAIANRWRASLKLPEAFPAEHAEFLALCHAAGQTRPTPLLLKYAAGDYNCLHQDLYGEHVFPLQVAILLSRPGQDFEGGEFVLTEQRPRMQSRVAVVPLSLGEAVIFAVNERPMHGTRGSYRVKMKHGVSALRAGQRYTAGIIFHDAA